ncbi:hypothetical protein SAMN04487983_1006182 [Streptomyces sp. yr375]|nr:hypothetical protein SAMN04487983_1006182 [Streptomyces sp. yr375]
MGPSLTGPCKHFFYVRVFDLRVRVCDASPRDALGARQGPLSVVAARLERG